MLYIYKERKTFKKKVVPSLRPNYIHSASNDIHTDGPRARASARARGYG